MTILLPLMYIFIDDLHCKPYGVKETVIELKAQVRSPTGTMGERTGSERLD